MRAKRICLIILIVVALFASCDTEVRLLITEDDKNAVIFHNELYDAINAILFPTGYQVSNETLLNQFPKSFTDSNETTGTIVYSVKENSYVSVASSLFSVKAYDGTEDFAFIINVDATDSAGKNLASFSLNLTLLGNNKGILSSPTYSFYRGKPLDDDSNKIEGQLLDEYNSLLWQGDYIRIDGYHTGTLTYQFKNMNDGSLIGTQTDVVAEEGKSYYLVNIGALNSDVFQNPNEKGYLTLEASITPDVAGAEYFNKSEKSTIEFYVKEENFFLNSLAGITLYFLDSNEITEMNMGGSSSALSKLIVSQVKGAVSENPNLTAGLNSINVSVDATSGFFLEGDADKNINFSLSGSGIGEETSYSLPISYEASSDSSVVYRKMIKNNSDVANETLTSGSAFDAILATTTGTFLCKYQLPNVINQSYVMFEIANSDSGANNMPLLNSFLIFTNVSVFQSYSFDKQVTSNGGLYWSNSYTTYSDAPNFHALTWNGLGTAFSYMDCIGTTVRGDSYSYGTWGNYSGVANSYLAGPSSWPTGSAYSAPTNISFGKTILSSKTPSRSTNSKAYVGIDEVADFEMFYFEYHNTELTQAAIEGREAILDRIMNQRALVE